MQHVCSIRAIENISEIGLQLRSQQFRTPVHLRAKRLFGFVQATGHAWMLRALSGEEKRDRPTPSAHVTGSYGPATSRLKRSNRLICITRDNGTPPGKWPPPRHESVGRIREFDGVVL